MRLLDNPQDSERARQFATLKASVFKDLHIGNMLAEPHWKRVLQTWTGSYEKGVFSHQKLQLVESHWLKSGWPVLLITVLKEQEAVTSGGPDMICVTALWELGIVYIYMQFYC